MARRIRVRRSAGGEGVMPAFSSLASTNASTGVRSQPGSFTAGGTVARRGAKAQWASSRPGRVRLSRFPWNRPRARPSPPTAAAPRWRAREAWPWEASSVRHGCAPPPGPEGSPPGFPGTMAGPLSPPLRRASRLSSRSPDDCFCGSVALLARVAQDRPDRGLEEVDGSRSLRTLRQTPRSAPATRRGRPAEPRGSARQTDQQFS